MKIVKPGYEILTKINSASILKSIEKAGRTCYKSESKITKNSAINFIKNIIARGHESVLEHQSVSVRIICDRGVSHELVRHRLASYSQESTRYVNYAKKGIEFIAPCFWKKGSDEYSLWKSICETSELAYLNLISKGSKPQEARSILPNSLKTEIVMTANLREWRHFFKVRAQGITGAPHVQMLEITLLMLCDFKELIPIVFDDIDP